MAGQVGEQSGEAVWVTVLVKRLNGAVWGVSGCGSLGTSLVGGLAGGLGNGLAGRFCWRFGGLLNGTVWGTLS